MIFVKNCKCPLVFWQCKSRNMSDDRLVLKKTPSQTIENMDFMLSQYWIFLKWLSDDFHQKIENLPFCLFLNKMGFENMFDDHLVRKQALIDWKILILHSGHIGIFPKGLNHDSGKKKKWKFIFVCFLTYKAWK